MQDPTAADLRAAHERGDMLALIHLSGGSTWSALSYLWNEAMNAHFGLGETHSSRCNADGTPTAATLAEFPRLAEAMQKARETIPRWIDLYERDLKGR